ncbi:response regulator [Alteromonas sp. CYL-A6]|uniref:response regulator n=1 Tax=Alteromonas nitratireducens TaxID=3390813 RepID=UPI0034C2B169
MKFSDKHVLIIEDQRPFLLLLRGLLNSMGAGNVMTTSSAEKALSLCRKQKYDVIVCDLHLGSDRKNGFELIEELRARKLIKPSTVFLIISADSARPVVLGSIERRPDDYLIKPFSQAQLKSRLHRAWQKRQFLQPVYAAVFDEDWATAITECERLKSTDSPYRRSCEQLLVELYWQVSKPEKAMEVLADYERGTPVMWAQIALGKTYLQLGNPQRAEELAQEVISRNRFNADAYDILAQSANRLSDGESAIAAIQQAIKLSPYSIPRHFSACRIARDNDDYRLASTSSQAIWDLSKRTVHHNPAYWCGYVRSLLDVAEYTDEKSTRNRYQQEALLVTQRGKTDPYLMRSESDFDVSIFESIVTARVNAIDGKMIDAKRHLATSQVAIEKKYDEPPLTLIPDSMKVMLDIGEFDDAMKYQSILKRNQAELDANSIYLMEREARKSAQKQSAYQKFNKKGMQFFQEGKYQQAREAFSQALSFAPVNTGVALNLLQCLLKLLGQNDKPEPTLVQECRRLNKLFDDVPLRRQHQTKYDEIKDALYRYIR